MERSLPTSNGGESQTKYEEFKPTQSDVKCDHFKVVTTKRSMLEGLRHHVMKFQSKNEVDPTDQVEFTRPIRLHRRDAGAGKSGAGAGEVEEEENEEDTKERARIEAQKEQRRRERENAQAQIAPKSKTKTVTDNRKKIMQIYERNDTPEAVKASRLRYEETLPWHLEDFDNKNTWVGSYEAALSDTHVVFFRESGHVDPQTGVKGEDRLRMVPVEKWYRFNAKDKANSLSLDDIEKQEKAGSTLTRWALHGQGADGPKKPKWMREKEQEKENKKRLEEMGMKSKLYLRSAGRGDEEAPRKRVNDDDYFQTDAPDADVIDFDEQEHFADDEEGVNGLFEGEDEDTKAAQDRIKREQLSANFFANKNEKDVWEQEESERMEKELVRKLEKSLRKKIVKHSDENPYSSDSDSEDSETERRKEEERKKEEERLAAEKEKLKPGESSATQPASGSSSKGSNTPASQSKLGNTKLSTSASQQNLKRSGSPNLSEASGNESARKKHKRNPGSGTDSEATDSGVKKMNRVHPITSTANSRPGSPVAGSVAGAPASRAASPGALAANQANALKSRTAAPAANLPPPSVEEIRAVIPPQGASMTQLISAFKGRLKPHTQKEFIVNVKKAGTYDKDKKIILPKAGGS
ncbi:hypothetical protein BC567DRAFT_240921 [Phyllosticta citribraziliensis]